MTYTIFMQPPGLPPGEYTYRCDSDQRLRDVMAALGKLETEIIDVEREGESMTTAELDEVLRG